MTTYTAWDGNEYPLPTPDGWYLGTDDRWWPEGHGPGPAPATPPQALSGMPSAAPPAGTAADWSTPPDTTIYSAPPAGTQDPGPFTATTPPDSGGGNGKAFVVVALVLVGLVAVGAGAFFALGSDDDGDEDTSVATTVFQTQQPDATEAPATTEASGQSETTAAAAAGRGSIDDPYQVGESIVVEYTDFASSETRTWSIEVLAPASDITQAVMDENQFNDPPEGDQAFIGAPIRVTYVSGPAPASLFELTFKAVGPSGVVLTTFDPSCGVIPDALDTFAELFEGGSVEGNVCWPASPADASDLTMLLEVFLEDTEVYADLGG